MGKKDSRLNDIIQYMKTHRSAALRDLARHFRVSEMTIRRDIEVLHASNLINNLHGTIIYNEDQILESDPNYYLVIKQKGVKDDEKERIAKEAARMVEPGDSIIIDIGTTTSKIIKFLPNNYPITLICYTANALADAIRKNFDRLFFGGGYYHMNSQMFESSEIKTVLKNIRASKVFVSAAGIDEQLGITCINQYEVETKLTSMQSATKKILLADASKFGVVRNGYFADLKDIDVIITDSSLSAEWQQKLRQRGIELHLV